MKKPIAILSFALFIGIVFSIVMIKQAISNSTSVKRDFAPEDLSDLVVSSQEVIIAKVTNKTKKITPEDRLTFYITEIDVHKSLKGDLKAKETIKLLQTDANDDPIVKEGESVLLFLEKYKGSLTDDKDTYVCKGLYEGHYKIRNGKVESSLKNKKINIFKTDSLKIDDVEDAIINVK